MRADARPTRPMSAVARVLAHQGGWDEMLVVLIPLVLFAGLLLVANRRATRAQADRTGAQGEHVDPSEPE